MKDFTVFSNEEITQIMEVLSGVTQSWVDGLDPLDSHHLIDEVNDILGKYTSMEKFILLDRG